MRTVWSSLAGQCQRRLFFRGRHAGEDVLADVASSLAATFSVEHGRRLLLDVTEIGLTASIVNSLVVLAIVMLLEAGYPWERLTDALDGQRIPLLGAVPQGWGHGSR